MLSNNFYLNYTHFPSFLQTIASQDDPFAILFRDAASKNTLLNNHKDISAKALECQSVLRYLGDGPAASGVKELKEQYEKIAQNIYQRITNETEGDYHRIRGVVFEILSMPKLEEVNQLELCRKYFDLMKKSQFFNVEAESLDQFSYDPGKEADYFIKSNPDIKSIALGCSKTVNQYHSFCLHKKKWPQEWHDKAMTIDINYYSGADIVSDMHDPKLWNEIPKDYFEEVSDHTHGSFLFDHSDTLRLIRDCLKPNGRLTFELSPDETSCAALETSGFVVEEGNILKNVWLKG
ncbi:MAG: hypothetical protein LW832_02460 [Parachlamydia sp.]|nr:hypothetical protein [Parachlamydia sp.]